MRERLFFHWRRLATGLSFAVFGLGAVVLALTVFPLASLWPGSAEARWRRSQRLVQRSFRFFLAALQASGAGRISIVNGERLADGSGALVLATHPTLLDVVVLVSLMPQADCVVKQALWRNPFLRGVVRGAGYLSNSSAEELLASCSEVLSEERKLLLFPEGTRSVPGQPLKFQRGAARVALNTQADIQPVTVTCDPPTLMKNTPWYRIPRRAWHIRVVVHDRIAPGELLNAEGLSEPAAVRRMTKALENFFERMVDEHEHAYQRIEGTGDQVAGAGGHSACGHRPASSPVR